MSDQVEHGPVEALWVGSYSQGIGPDGHMVVLDPGVTKMLVGYHEAHDSDDWKPIGQPTVDDLREKADSLGVDTKGLRKAQLEDAIASAEAELAHSGPMTEITETEG